MKIVYTRVMNSICIARVDEEHVVVSLWRQMQSHLIQQSLLIKPRVRRQSHFVQQSLMLILGCHCSWPIPRRKAISLDSPVTDLDLEQLLFLLFLTNSQSKRAISYDSAFTNLMILILTGRLSQNKTLKRTLFCVLTNLQIWSDRKASSPR